MQFEILGNMTDVSAEVQNIGVLPEQVHGLALNLL